MTQTARMTAVRFHRYGDEQVLMVEEVARPQVGPDEVLIEVQACGVNHIDLDLRSGVSRYPLDLPHTLGREIAGTVVEVGPAVLTARVGQSVLVSTYLTCNVCRYCRSSLSPLCDQRRLPGLNLPGGYAEYVSMPASALLPIPPPLTAVQAAALPVAFGTAWQSLIKTGGLRAGESVLITGASGGVGTAALQVARQAGAFTIAVSSSDEKLSRLVALGADAALNYRSQPLVEAVLEITDGQGVDVVLDSVGGELFRFGLACLAKNGRLVVCGAHAGEHEPLDLIAVFRRRQHILGAGGATMEDLQTVMRLAAAKRVLPVIDQVIPLTDAADAHRRLARREHFGKIVLSAHVG